MAAPDCLALQEVIHEVDVWVVWVAEVVGVQRFMTGEACAVLLKCIVTHCHSVIWSCFKSFLKYCIWVGLPKNDASLEDDSFKSNVFSARFGLQVVQQTQISPLDVDAVESFADGKILDDCLEARSFISLDHAICGRLWNILWTIHDKIAV